MRYSDSPEFTEMPKSQWPKHSPNYWFFLLRQPLQLILPAWWIALLRVVIQASVLRFGGLEDVVIVRIQLLEGQISVVEKYLFCFFKALVQERHISPFGCWAKLSVVRKSCKGSWKNIIFTWQALQSSVYTGLVDGQPSRTHQEIETHRKPDLKKVPTYVVESNIERDRTNVVVLF